MPAAAPNWTAAELATLAQLAETFVRGGAVRRAELAAQALAAAADPAQVRRLRLVLRLIESPIANLVLAGRPRAFSDLSPAARERYLLGWADSRLALRRTAFHGLRKLLTFLAYADPGERVPNPLLAAIGYRPDDPAVGPTPSPIRPHRPALPSDPDRPIELDAEVVVVGSGAGGGIVAHDLARAGRSVVVLEAGPFVDETAMPRDELAAFDRLYLDHGLVSTWDGAVTILAGGAVGGGTLVNWTCIDSPPDVRAEWARDHGVDGWDAPLAERDVMDLERELGVAPTPTVAPKDAAILRGSAALGWDAEPIRRNAAACEDCGSCPFGCRRGTKQSGIRAHLAEAALAGARIVPGAPVRRVLLDRGRAVGVEATLADPWPGAGPPRRLIVRASQVIVAAGALRTPALLERSGLDHPALGRHLRIHPVPVVAARFVEPVDMWRGPMQGARCARFPAPGNRALLVHHRIRAGAPGAARARLPVARDGRARGLRRPGPPLGPAHRGDARRRPGPRVADARRHGPDRLPARRDRRRDAAPRTRLDGPTCPCGGRPRDRRARYQAAVVRWRHRPRGDRRPGVHGLPRCAGGVRLPAESRHRLLGPPDGHGTDGSGSTRARVPIRMGASGPAGAPAGRFPVYTWPTRRSSRPRLA